MLIKEYKAQQKQTWNEFIQNSKQGTFLLNRNFMDYHSDRFEDSSLMFYNEKDKLIAVLPANIKGNVLYSHQGLSYGGLIYGSDAKTTDILECFNSLKKHAKENNIQKLIYKRIPSIYHNYPADEDLYALFRNNAKLIRRDIGYVIDIHNAIPVSRNKTRYLKNMKNFFITEDTDFELFHSIMKEALSIHKAKPVHSSQEMTLLTDRFKNNIKLYGVFDSNNVMVAGCWCFINKDVIHIQNMLAKIDAKNLNVIDFMYNWILSNLCVDKKYLSFGISTEQDGRYLNEGLTFQKESFGGRGVCHDFYELNF